MNLNAAPVLNSRSKTNAKVVLVVLDGLGDIAMCEQTIHLLEAATTPEPRTRSPGIRPSGPRMTLGPRPAITPGSVSGHLDFRLRSGSTSVAAA